MRCGDKLAPAYKRGRSPPAGGDFFARVYLEGVVFEFFHEGGFADFAAAHQEEFGFQEEHGGFFDFGEIVQDSLVALFDDFLGWIGEGVVIEIQTLVVISFFPFYFHVGPTCGEVRR